MRKGIGTSRLAWRLALGLAAVAMSLAPVPAAATPPPRSPPPAASAEAAFAASLREQADRLTIPGIAYAVVHRGSTIAQGSVVTGEAPPFTVDTPLRFASVTKAMTAVLLMRAVERGALSLDDPAGRWLPQFADRPAITIRHLAGHVSQGDPGREYVYATSRYALLGEVVSRALGTDSYEQALRREIIEPLGMTWHDSPHLGAHAGLVSTVADMARFVAALQQERLLGRATFNAMVAPFRRGDLVALPVGIGWFTRPIGGETMVWSFGQDDPDHGSALVLLLPDRDLGLVLLANTDELSNPFRLLMGDLRYSPFAFAFLEAFAPDLGAAVGERERWITAALADIAREDVESARQHLRAAAALAPAPTGDDLVLHFALGAIADQSLAAYALETDRLVLAAHPANRWALLLSAGLNARFGRSEPAAARYEAILALRNQEPDGLVPLFRAWSYDGLARLFVERDPARALAYVDQAIATGVQGGTLEGLQALRAQLAGEGIAPARTE